MDKMKIEEVQSTAKKQRIASHTHIKGLGLEPNGTAISLAAGLVGQVDAREAAGLLVDMTRQKKMAGCALLLAVPPGTWKTVLALEICQELGSKVAVGDVIYIEVNSGAVKRVGRSDAFATEFDLEAEEHVPLPKGDVHKKMQHYYGFKEKGNIWLHACSTGHLILCVL